MLCQRFHPIYRDWAACVGRSTYLEFFLRQGAQYSESEQRVLLATRSFRGGDGRGGDRAGPRVAERVDLPSWLRGLLLGLLIELLVLFNHVTQNSAGYEWSFKSGRFFWGDALKCWTSTTILTNSVYNLISIKYKHRRAWLATKYRFSLFNHE